MEEEEFRAKMNQAHAYYKAQLDGDKTQDSPIGDFVSELSSGPAPEGLDAICEEMRAEETAGVAVLKEDVLVAKEDVKSESDMDAFHERMAKEKERAKENASKRIDKAFSELIDYADKHPEQQSFVLTATEKINGLIIVVYDTLAPIFAELAKQLWKWLQTAYEWIKDNFAGILQTIAKWVFFVVIGAPREKAVT